MESNERVTPVHERILGRLLSLSDGIFAFAITLLILNIVLPYGTSRAEVPQALLSLWPKYLAFLISFVVIGLYWIVHVRQFRFIRRFDTGLLWLNLLFLMFIILIPFSTSVLSDFEETASVVLYAANMACAGFAATGLWIYAARRRLLDAKLGRTRVRRGIIMNLIAPGWFSLSIGLAFINAGLAVYSWLLIGVAHRVIDWKLKLPESEEDI
jgi:uncharacterized membrane protein